MALLLHGAHALPWLLFGEFRTQAAMDAVAAARNPGALDVSAITAREPGIADRKRTGKRNVVLDASGDPV